MNQLTKIILSVVFFVATLTACGGGASQADALPAPGLVVPFVYGPAAAGFTNITGKVTFDHVPVVVNSAGIPRLAFDATTRRAARAVVVEIVDANSNVVLAQTSTNALGEYLAQVPSNQLVFVRANAQLWLDAVSTPDVMEVVDNTQDGAQYVLDTAVFLTATSLLTQNLHASSGWGGSAYTGVRAAAPFAILDTLYSGVLKIRSVDAGAVFPKFTVHWSESNITSSAENLALGQIGTSYFSAQFLAGAWRRDLYLLGRADNDSDEYDAHVITHEFGHYLQSAFSRDDSPGGNHSRGDMLDMRVAFSEGFSNAWSALALNDKIYADTGVAGVTQGSSHDVSLGDLTRPSWLSERSVEKVLWDMGTHSAIGFAPLWQTMRSGMTQSPALTGMHSFAFNLVQANPSFSQLVAAILFDQKITLPEDVYGAGETHFGQLAFANLNPIYMSHPGLGNTLAGVCLTDEADLLGAGNKAGEHRYVRMFLPAGLHKVTVTRAFGGATQTDPDFVFYGNLGALTVAESTVADSEMADVNVTGGEYVLVVSDFNFRTNAAAASQPCFDVLVN